MTAQPGDADHLPETLLTGAPLLLVRHKGSVGEASVHVLDDRKRRDDVELAVLEWKIEHRSNARRDACPRSPEGQVLERVCNAVSLLARLGGVGEVERGNPCPSGGKKEGDVARA